MSNSTSPRESKLDQPLLLFHCLDVLGKGFVQAKNVALLLI